MDKVTVSLNPPTGQMLDEIEKVLQDKLEKNGRVYLCEIYQAFRDSDSKFVGNGWSRSWEKKES